jgi:hypothetical protein
MRLNPATGQSYLPQNAFVISISQPSHILGDSPPEVGIVVKDHVQQGIVNFQVAVVFDETQLAELIQEKAHARARRADHFGERLLTNPCYDWIRPPLLAEVRHQKEKSRQTLLARIKKLINKVFLDAGVASQDVGQEHFGELRFLVKHAHHGGLAKSHDGTVRHRSSSRQAQGLAAQAALAEEISLPMEGDDRFLP